MVESLVNFLDASASSVKPFEPVTLLHKPQEIAAGDLEQRIDFMGDFSIAFNQMTQQLKGS